MKKNLFGINFEPERAPSYSTRSFSMDALLGGGKIKQKYSGFNARLEDKTDLRKTFKSNLDIRTLPSAWSLLKEKRGG